MLFTDDIIFYLSMLFLYSSVSISLIYILLTMVINSESRSCSLSTIALAIVSYLIIMIITFVVRSLMVLHGRIYDDAFMFTVVLPGANLVAVILFVSVLYNLDFSFKDTKYLVAFLVGLLISLSLDLTQASLSYYLFIFHIVLFVQIVYTLISICRYGFLQQLSEFCFFYIGVVFLFIMKGMINVFTSLAYN